MKLKKYDCPVVDYVNLCELPEDLRDAVSDESQENDYNMFAYSDGDYYYRISFAYPPKVWWLDELKALLPQEVIDRDKFAVYISQ